MRADLSVTAVSLGHATDLVGAGRGGSALGESCSSESESDDGVEDHFDGFDCVEILKD